MTDLQNIVNIAGQALMEEDAYLAGCLARRKPRPYTGDHPPGMLWRTREVFYQFLTYRKLLLCFPKLVDVERDSLFDFVIYSETGALEAVGEMKRWMTTTGEPEVPLIQKDIDKIIRRNLPGFVLIVSANPPGTTHSNLVELARLLGQHEDRFATPFRFPSAGVAGECEMFVAGIFVEATVVAHPTQ